MSLQKYKRKRDFKQTAEPSGGRSKSNGAGGGLFVIQKHDATRLHYDIRLAMDGVLKSWAAPKGFPFTRGEKHLAVHVEDHPIEYADFEGTIPPGNYGAGTVMLWDRGDYEVEGADPSAALRKGKLRVHFKGAKLKGDWTLIRTKGGDSSKENWLILKSGESIKPISARSDDRSVATGRSMNRIAKDNDLQWKNNRATEAKRPPTKKKPAAKSASQKSSDKESDLNTLPKGAIEFIPPMKAVLKEKLPTGKEWIYEIKFDGIRALALKKGNSVALWSRNEKKLNYSTVADALKNLPHDNLVLDGEVVALDENGRPSFQLLQTFKKPGGQKPPLFYYAFDLLRQNGRDITSLPLTARRRLLERILEAAPSPLRFSGPINAASTRVIQEMQKRGLEGVIAKKIDSTYQPGARSPSWVKLKWTHEQEFVIGGYTPPEGSRTWFGAILVGVYQDGQLMFASKVGTGFDSKLLKTLHDQFQPLAVRQSPFANLSKQNRPAVGLTTKQLAETVWLRPELVAQIKFSEWPRDGRLRHPVFLALREDKAPYEVIREHHSP